jgi:tRNA A-37 threonylcarbamoyl transferase component Bud32/tetratricopeptide (TPR) repeat protein
VIGETIKDFTITAQLGRGGMGEVYAAEQRIVKTKVAIKMLQPQISAEKAHVDRFFNEAIAVSKIRHAGIVKIFDVGHHAGRAYLVMEYLEGEPLSARLRKGLGFETAIAIARQITSILDATHAAGITHRDLKPDNVFLVPDAELGERVRILDFGIAKLGDVQATAAQMSMGTPAYMPPELWQDAASSGPATDVYALGCVLFELCTGRPPFIVTAVSDACGRHLTEVPPRIRTLRPELPAALDDLIARMLEKAQDARPSTKAIAAALSTITTSGIAATLPHGPAISPSKGSTPAPMSPTPPIATALGHGSGGPADAAKLEAEGRWMELVKLLGKQAETAPPAEQAALHFRIATIYQDRFANMAEAIKSYERVLAHEPDHRKAIEALRSLYEKRRDWEKLLEIEKGELGRTAPEKRADKAVEVAKLASVRVSKPDIQLYWWERVIEHEPDHRQAFDELAKLYAHAGRWTDLAELLRRHAAETRSQDDRAATLRKLAVVQADRLADRAAAIDALAQLLDATPADANALGDLRQGKDVAWSSLGDAYRLAPALGTGSGVAATGDHDGSGPKRTNGPGSATAPASPAPAVVSTVGSSSSGSSTGTSGSSRDDGVRATGKKSSAMLAAVGVLALAGGGIFFATRGGGSSDSQTGGSQLGGDKTNEHGSNGRETSRNGGTGIGSQSGGTGSQAEANGTGSQAEANGTGSQALVNNSGSAAQAAASGLVLSYRVLSKPAGNGEFRAIKPGETLHTDDRLAFEVMVSEQAHVFLTQRTKGKLISILFPNSGIEITNPLPPNTWTRIPSGTRSFRLNDKDLGAESVYFVAARTPPANLARAFEPQNETKKRELEEQIVAVAMEKRGDCAGRARQIVLDGGDDCAVKTRGLELDDEKTARRVRGMTVEDVVFVPFTFTHAAKPAKAQPVPAIRSSPAYKACFKQCKEQMGTDEYCGPNCEVEAQP